jgi:hypothetical protein
MALRFIDGFDHYNSMTQKWTTLSGTPTFTSVGTRFSVGQCLVLSFANPVKALDSQATWVIGGAVKFGSFGTTSSIIGVRDVGTQQVDVRVNASGNLTVTKNGTVIGTSTSSMISLNVWYYLELKVTIHNTTGAYEVRLNGVTVPGLSATGVDTRNTANNSANEIFMSTAGGITYTYDDLYVCDGTGSTNNDFLGDVRVDTILPTADGSSTDFTPSTGTDNYAMVDDATPDSDSTYIASGTLNDLDLYTFADLQSLTGSVFGIQSVIFGRKDDAGTRSVAPAIKTGVTTAVGADFTLAASYSYNLQIFETNPANGSAAWTISDVNNSEFGVKVTA